MKEKNVQKLKMDSRSLEINIHRCHENQIPGFILKPEFLILPELILASFLILLIFRGSLGIRNLIELP